MVGSGHYQKIEKIVIMDRNKMYTRIFGKICNIASLYDKTGAVRTGVTLQYLFFRQRKQANKILFIMTDQELTEFLDFLGFIHDKKTLDLW